LLRLDKGAAIAALAAREPRERALGRIDVCTAGAAWGFDHLPHKPEMLTQKRIHFTVAGKLGSREVRASTRRDRKQAVTASHREIRGNERVGLLSGSHARAAISKRCKKVKGRFAETCFDSVP
jgi:hypothetical protein